MAGGAIGGIAPGIPPIGGAMRNGLAAAAAGWPRTGGAARTVGAADIMVGAAAKGAAAWGAMTGAPAAEDAVGALLAVTPTRRGLYLGSWARVSSYNNRKAKNYGNSRYIHT